MFDALDYSNVASFESAEPILSLAVSDKDETLALGMVTGFVSVAQRSKIDTANIDIYDQEEYNKLSEKEKAKVIRPNFETIQKGKKGLPVDGETSHKRRNFENKYNRLFRKFEYDKVVSMSLSSTIRFIDTLIDAIKLERSGENDPKYLWLYYRN